MLSDHTIESEGEDSSPDSAERSSLIPILLDTKRWQAAAHTVRAVAEKHEEQQATWVLSLARDLLRCCEGLMVYLYTRIQSCAPECISFPSSEQLRVEASSSSAAVSDMMSKRTLALLDLKILIERTQMVGVLCRLACPVGSKPHACAPKATQRSFLRVYCVFCNCRSMTCDRKQRAILKLPSTRDGRRRHPILRAALRHRPLQLAATAARTQSHREVCTRRFGITSWPNVLPNSDVNHSQFYGF